MWIFEELLRSRVHRKLRNCPRFSNNVHIEDVFFAKLEGEEAIGCYSFEDTDKVIITTLGIRTRFSGETQFIPYSEMLANRVLGDWSIPTAKTTADTIQISMKDKTVRTLWIRGGDGRLQDIWLFEHFLSHAIRDYQKYPSQIFSG
jgi:hypothetical protein